MDVCKQNVAMIKVFLGGGLAKSLKGDRRRVMAIYLHEETLIAKFREQREMWITINLNKNFHFFQISPLL